MPNHKSRRKRASSAGGAARPRRARTPSPAKRSDGHKKLNHDTSAAPWIVPARRKAAFPIVGIGASAGGLEAFEQFLKSVPPKSGMAFVFVQHLDPKHKGMLVELL